PRDGAAAPAQALRGGGADFDAWWRRALHDGLVRGSEARRVEVSLQANWANAPGTPQEGGDRGGIVLRPDPTGFDRRVANNRRPQELPKPITKLTWDNAAFLSPATAVRLGFATAGREERANGQLVAFEVPGQQGQTVEAPLWVLPGHAN